MCGGAELADMAYNVALGNEKKNAFSTIKYSTSLNDCKYYPQVILSITMFTSVVVQLWLILYSCSGFKPK